MGSLSSIRELRVKVAESKECVMGRNGKQRQSSAGCDSQRPPAIPLTSCAQGESPSGVSGLVTVH